MILDYLQKQNRPYSATDISANLHNAVTKANAVKLLKELSDNGDLVVCISGRCIGTMMMTELSSGLCMLQMLRMLHVDVAQFEVLGSQGFPWFKEDQV
ncbi:hypothetical protein AOL_s00110g170 [Orbilia oligospora ATCC 24927]|uniref:Homologous-pairing protein 2 winged helix domain-containing protein n=1 Tax=Arthrobotrys oligospora (strain ATCC 24927 / CBS 115.81 / DSM 1491) TaxID=756982 RepID=G1XL00_ARTOA|nr:hypothetical protein AOL_s00110g170 [Orbilia oligospora ATCC 24927]EGX46006.1 hypothetical protein AOL_s00110g170 [Orbilia oligospora ATCC 24927]